MSIRTKCAYLYGRGKVNVSYFSMGHQNKRTSESYAVRAEVINRLDWLSIGFIMRSGYEVELSYQSSRTLDVSDIVGYGSGDTEL